MITPQQALKRLQDGNRRFATDHLRQDHCSNDQRRRDLMAGQKPFAIIIGCSDSRVPAELIFDQGLGDLFVIRVAGNVVAPSQIGSVEYAAERFGTRLVVVLGHSKCGAVKVTLDELERPKENRSANLSSIVSRIQPAVEALLKLRTRQTSEQLLDEAVRANIRTSAFDLRHGSPILEAMILHHELLVVSAEYSLETGVVEFFGNDSR